MKNDHVCTVTLVHRHMRFAYGRMFIMRGLPGAGKDFQIANFLLSKDCEPEDYVVCSADDYFYDDKGDYNHDFRKLPRAHNECLDKALKALYERKPFVFISNTNTCTWEYQHYIRAGILGGYEVKIVDIYDGDCTDEELVKRNAHGVPLAGIQAMRARWEPTVSSL
jgi:hypothetical protein